MSFTDVGIEDAVADEVVDTELDSVAEGDASTDDVVDEGVTDDGAEPEPTFTIKWKGAEREVTQDELISLAQQGEDYTQKSQALAQVRDAAATWQAIEASFAKDPKGTLTVLAERFGAAEVVDTTDMDPLERQVHEATARLARMEEAERQRAVQAELATVKQRYNEPDLDEQELLLFAYQNGLGNLDVAYKAMKFEEKATAAAATAKTTEQRQAKVAAKRSAPVVAGGAKRSAGVTAPGASDHLSIREALLEAMREHGMSTD